MVFARTLVLVMLCAVLTAAAWGQSWTDQLRRADSLLNADQADQAVTVFDSVLAQDPAASALADATALRTVARLGDGFGAARQLRECISAFRLAIRMSDRLHEPDDVGVAYFHHQIGRALFYLGEYADAETECREALRLWEMHDSPRALDAHIMLGNVLSQYGTERFDEWTMHYKRAAEIGLEYYGKDDYSTARALWGVANTYFNEGMFAEAEPLYQQTLKVLTDSLGKDSPATAGIVINLALISRNLGNSNQAVRLFERALSIMQNSARSNPLGEARALEGIAAALAEQGDDDGALEYYRSALDLITEDIGGGAPRVARTYNLLALHLMHMGDLAGAERHQLRAVYIADSVFGHYSPHVAKHLLDLAAIWDAQNRLAEAEALYREALAIRRTWLPDDHTSIAECKADLANFYLNHGDQRQGLPLALEAAEISMKNLREFAPVVSERDALIYSQTMHESVNRFLSSYCAAGGKGVGIEDAVDLILNGTGEVSDAIIERRHLLSQPMDSTATRLWNSYRAARLVLSDLYVGGPDGPDDERFKPVTDSLTKVIAEREAELAKHIDRYRQTKKYARIDHQQVASLLPDSSVLIEYLRHDDESADMPDPARAHYLAAVIGSDGSLEIVPLGAAETIDRLADDYRSHMAHAAALGHLPTADDFAEYQPIARGLYDQLVKPVAHAIADKDLLFISPDAQLNWVSFAALIDDSSRFLIESHPIHYLSGGRDLVRLQTKDPRGSGLLALGNPAFDTTSQAGDPLSQTGANPASPTAPLNPRSNCGQLKNLKLSPLPQTRSEIERVVRVWQDETGEPFDTLLGADATEERFKQVATGRRVVHISTHAFYLEGACGGGDSDEAGAEDQEHGTATDTDRLVATQRRRSFDDEESQMTEDPLVQSGLFLAGCVSARKSQPDPLVRTLDQSRTEEDGVLTAAEIAGMNLIGTQLVVLSACETGLGRLYQGEGVYGLRRAFQIAGARTVLSTLWPIADELTAPMLPTIYRNGNPASSGKASTDPLPYRLRKSQLDWIDTLRTRGLAPHPYSWGAFVAQGDWR